MQWRRLRLQRSWIWRVSKIIAGTYKPAVHSLDRGTFTHYFAPVAAHCIVMRMSVCLSVCPLICAAELHQIVLACCLWSWLSLPLMALQYVMYFRFRGWHHVFMPCVCVRVHVSACVCINLSPLALLVSWQYSIKLIKDLCHCVFNYCLLMLSGITFVWKVGDHAQGTEYRDAIVKRVGNG